MPASQEATSFMGIGYRLTGAGSIRYAPVVADPARGFGPHEVHPQKVPITCDGSTRLEHNGDWLVTLPRDGVEMTDDRRMTTLVITARAGGRVTAERLAAIRNGGLPTRVVDLADEEHVSLHTQDSVERELSERASLIGAGG